MPEHRRGTPGRYYALESFLWRDFESAEDWEAWTAAHELAGKVAPGAEGFRKAMMLQGALRALEAANNGEMPDEPGSDAASATAVLNRLVAELKVQPAVDPLGGIRLETTTGGQYAAVGAVLVMALNAMSSGDWRRFKLCRDPDCRASYYDASKSGTKIWCSMAGCGSRNKMRRLRAKAT
jgi:predicted RNA-binding Zn ribbon-like protein